MNKDILNEMKDILKAMIQEQAISPERAEIDFNIAAYLLENGIQMKGGKTDDFQG